MSKKLVTALTAALIAGGAFAQAAKEQFFPVLVYRTGAYGPNGAPWANGYVDYLKLINAQGGINGVKISFEECEFGYATDRGVECYERLKGKNGGATVVQPLSTGVTFALTEKAPADKIPLITAGYGRSESQDGGVFKWNFPLIGSYWMAADVLVQHIAKKEGGWDKLKGKKFTLVYHDSPYGKEPIPMLTERSKMHGFELNLIPVTAPRRGAEVRPWTPEQDLRPCTRPPFLCSAKEKGGKERRPRTALAPRLRRGVPCGARKPAPARTRGVRFAHSAQTGWPSQKGRVPAARGPSCCAPRRRRGGGRAEQPNSQLSARCLPSTARGSAVGCWLLAVARRLRRRAAQTRGPRAAGTHILLTRAACLSGGSEASAASSARGPLVEQRREPLPAKGGQGRAQ
jgi:hypothetical protein